MAGSASSEDGEISGINVTPLVDVMLVLLVIFMTTTTLIEHETIKVELPKAANGGAATAKPLAITMERDGTVSVDGKRLPGGIEGDKALMGLAQTRQAAQKDPLTAMIGADDKAFHGQVIHVLDVLKQAGVTKFGFEIQQVQ